MSQNQITAEHRVATDNCVRRDKQDTVWMLSLYGTAIGAGILFLPINAGMNGIVPLIVLMLLAFPMTFLSHRALCRFVLTGTAYHDDITEVVEQHFGVTAGKIITTFYFFAIYPFLLMYSVAITNTTQSFIVNQLGYPQPPRAIVSIVLTLALMSIARLGQQVIVRAMSMLVYPFVAILMLLTLYLIPHWNGAIFSHGILANGESGFTLLKSIWLLIPVIVFSFNHSPIISSFALAQKARYGDSVEPNCTRILKGSHILMVLTGMLFVCSCVFSLSPQDLLLAKQQNISILSYLANHFDTPIMAYIAPLIAFVAISKSFLGHYLGAKEGMRGLMLKFSRKTVTERNVVRNDHIVDIFIIATCWIVATINPSILGMIEMMGGPIIALLLFLMPMYAVHKVPAMQKYRSPVADAFITGTGLIAISAILYGFFVS